MYRGKAIVPPLERRSLVLGRDATADPVIADRMAAGALRDRAAPGKFVIADRSANGTYLSIDGDSEIVLRREEALLRGHGFIALGQTRATATEVVEFFCE